MCGTRARRRGRTRCDRAIDRRRSPCRSCRSWCTRESPSPSERGVASVEMGEVGNLIRTQGAAAAGVVGPAEHARLEEGAIDDQLRATLEKVEKANLTLGPFELVLFLHRHPRHPPALGGQRIT